MPENNPADTSPEETKPRKKRPIHRRTFTKNPAATTEKSMSADELDTSLSAIYKDESGVIPNMKKMNIKKSSPFVTLLSWFLGIALVGVALAWLGFFWLAPGGSGNSDSVRLSLSGPTDLTVNTTSTYTITFQNNGTVSLHNVSFSLYYPKGFIFATSSPALGNALHNALSLGTITPGELGTIVISGKNYGALSEEGSWRVFMNYTPSNFNSELQKTATLTTKLTASPITLALSGPDKVVIGSEATYTFTINYDKDFILPFEVSPVIPPNFVITSSTPALTGNNVWEVTPTINTSTPETAPLPLKFILQGKFISNQATSTPLRGVVALPVGTDRLELARTELASELVKNDLDFNLAINGSLTDFSSTLGDTLAITLHLKNTSADTIKNAAVNLVVDGPSINRQSILKWSDIADPANGDIQGQQLDALTRRGIITWNTKKIPALAQIKPNDEINIDVRLPIKDAQSFDPASIKTPTITVTGGLTFVNQNGATQIVNAGPITITLNSDLKLKNQDAVNKNADGQDVHAVTWMLTNSIHPLKNITLTAMAYGDIAVATSTPAAGTLFYDPATKQITWAIAEMPQSVDVLNSNFTLTVLKNNPTQNTLLSKVHLLAEDEVTQQKIELSGDAILLNGGTSAP